MIGPFIPSIRVGGVGGVTHLWTDLLFIKRKIGKRQNQKTPFKVNTLSVNVPDQESVSWGETLATFYLEIWVVLSCNSLAWCSLKHTGWLTLTHLQLWVLNFLTSVSFNSLSQSSTCSPVHLPRLQTDWRTESWTDRHELCHHGYHSCCRLPPICSWRRGAAFTCLSVRRGSGVAPG